MIAGMLPLCRILRAEPVPVSSRDVAFKDAVAISVISVELPDHRSPLAPSVYSREAASSLPCDRASSLRPAQSNNELTDCSACVNRIALESNSPTDRTQS